VDKEELLVGPVEGAIPVWDPRAVEMTTIDKISTRIGIDPEKDSSAAGVHVIEHEYAR